MGYFSVFAIRMHMSRVKVQSDTPADMFILEEVYKDVSGNGAVDKVTLYIDTELDYLMLSVNEKSIFITDRCDADYFIKEQPGGFFTYDLEIRGQYIAINLLFNGTQKFGTTVWLYAFRYIEESNSAQLDLTFSSDALLEQKCPISRIDKENNLFITNILGYDGHLSYDPEYHDLYLEYIYESDSLSLENIVSTYHLYSREKTMIYDRSNMSMVMSLWSGAGTIGGWCEVKLLFDEQGLRIEDIVTTIP